MLQNLFVWTASLETKEPTSFNSLPLISNVTSINEAIETAIEESKLKSDATKRSEVTEHCQKYRDSLHTVMNNRPDQSEY